MVTLRVRLAAPFDPAAPAAWWRAADDGRVLDRGSAAPAHWPPADRVEVALAPADVRIAAIALPPMSDARRASAAAYALEDQLAAPAEAAHLRLTSPASPGAPTIARIADRAAIARLAAHRPAIDRVVAEPDLAPADGAWRWCADADGRGFVRRPDGSALAVDPAAGGALPAEIAAAIAQARHDAAGAPLRVVVDAAVEPGRLAEWSRATGATFVEGTPWSLERVPAAAWRFAPDLREGLGTGAAAPRGSIARRFVPALALVLAAIALHVATTLGGWLHDRYAAWRADRAVVSLARDAGLDDVADAEAASAALARLAASSIHASARMADGDLLPLLARAAPTLAALPPGALRKLAYGDRRLVADLAALDEARVTAIVRELAAAGLSPIAAPAAGGVRIAMTEGS